MFKFIKDIKDIKKMQAESLAYIYSNTQRANCKEQFLKTDSIEEKMQNLSGKWVADPQLGTIYVFGFYSTKEIRPNESSKINATALIITWDKLDDRERKSIPFEKDGTSIVFSQSLFEAYGHMVKNIKSDAVLNLWMYNIIESVEFIKE